GRRRRDVVLNQLRHGGILPERVRRPFVGSAAAPHAATRAAAGRSGPLPGTLFSRGWSVKEDADRRSTITPPGGFFLRGGRSIQRCLVSAFDLKREILICASVHFR